ncbi:MAG: translation initiation factor IF-2 [Solirubrobacterales bacterium]|nr:translation initiation factor IF-2 [Solirubrobacterales bacterium]MBV9916063.1 translation initiation factor IF-2 [Solirubrobacterales bacterium]
MNKRVHEIAKERGLPTKDVIARLRAAGVNVKAASSSVDEATATRVLGNGGGPAGASGSAPAAARQAAAAPAAAPPARAETQTPAQQAAQASAQSRAQPASGGDAARARPPASTGASAPAGQATPQVSAGATQPQGNAPARSAPSPPPAGDGAAAAAETSRAANPDAGAHKRPTRDSLQGERAPGSAGGRRRVVIDSQASRRAGGGGPPAQSNQPPRRQRRGRRRRGVYDEEAESRPAASRTALAEPDAIRINSGSTVKDVAEYLSVGVPEIMKQLMALGEMKTLTQTLSDEAIVELADKLNKEVEIVHTEDETVAEPVYDDAEEDLAERAPVVTIMGHVDHGKTSLLDAIRETEVAAGEAGGITQHIGAYQVHHGEKIVTFLDTPGHEAFTAMRARGASVTDIAVIVVAADDGVKPQTQEAVDHAKEADVPILVAVNKIDKEGADPTRVRSEMTNLGLQPVEWGGDTDFVDVSARTKQGLDDLLDTIAAMAELQELRANPEAPASGTVIESKLDPGRGPVVTILIMRGTLEVGDALVAGAHWGRVRAMHDFLGTRVGQALPGEPVEVLGFDGVPEAGERVRVVEHERRARQLAGERATRLKTESLARRSGKRVSLEDIFGSGIQELNLVLKSDVAGSLEAIEDEIAKLPQEEVSVNVIRRAVGAVSESDVMLAAASDAVILAFNVRPVGDARAVAEREGVEIRHYSVIYRAIEELRSAMQGMLAPEEVEEALGSAEVRQIFRASRVGTIAGSHVLDGRITRGARVRLVRDGTVVYDGEVASLRRFNDDVREVTAGYDCGIVLRDYADIKDGDVLEAYGTRQVERELA